jgi:hypothetical protein
VHVLALIRKIILRIKSWENYRFLPWRDPAVVALPEGPHGTRPETYRRAIDAEEHDYYPHRGQPMAEPRPVVTECANAFSMGRPRADACKTVMYRIMHRRALTRRSPSLGDAVCEPIARPLRAPPTIWPRSSASHRQSIAFCGQPVQVVFGTGCAIALGSHWTIEGNQPLIRVNALFGAITDHWMCWPALTGRLEGEYRRLRLVD